MAINFPHNPTVGQVHTESSLGKSWKWDGTTWKIYSTASTGISLSDLSVVTNPVGTASLFYNTSNGVFTYTPPDLGQGTSRYTLPIASSTVLGGIKVGSNLSIDVNGVLSGVSSYTLPTASTTVLGGVKIDGTTVTINNGVISASPSSNATSITVAVESTDTETFPIFATASTGSLAPKTHTAFKFNSSTGELQAGSFKKEGGSSSEFLKADGSVDTNTYLTSSGGNTTYDFAASASAANVKLTLTGSDSTNDDVLITAGNNVTFTSVTSSGFTINSAAGGGGSGNQGNDSVAVGSICLWSGNVSNIPTGWVLCDGQNNTPDLRDKFIIGAKQDDSGVAKTNIEGSLTQTGGSKDAVAVTHDHGTITSSNEGSHGHGASTNSTGSHSHGASSNNTGSHGHGISDPGHAHRWGTDDNIGAGGPVDWDNPDANGGTDWKAFTDSQTTGISISSGGDHSHTISINNGGDHSHNVTINNGGGHTHTTQVGSSGVSGTNKNLPPYYALCYIMKSTQAGASFSLSVSTNPTPSGGGALSYNNTTGVFSFTPAAIPSTPTLDAVLGAGATSTKAATVGDLTCSNLTVNGTTTTVNSNTVNIGDSNITLNSDETGTPSQNGGLTIERGTSTNVELRWNETTDKWQFTNDGTNYTNMGGGSFISLADTPGSFTADKWLKVNTVGNALEWADAPTGTGGSGTANDSVAIGTICMWSGTVANIPTGWALCDGSVSGRPDLRDKFVIGARQDDGGVAKTNVTGSLTQSGGSKDSVLIQHNHGSSTGLDGGHDHGGTTGNQNNDHTHSGTFTGSAATDTQGAHSHPIYVSHEATLNLGGTRYLGDPNGDTALGTPNTGSAGGHAHNFSVATSGTTGGQSQSHTHTISNKPDHDHTINNSGTGDGSNTNLPPYYALCYIIKVTASGAAIPLSVTINSTPLSGGDLTYDNTTGVFEFTPAAVFSGDYTDLTNKPTIPAGQVNSDWNATTGVAEIFNKPTLFDGNYNSLINKPTIPSSVNDLSDVSVSGPTTGQVLKWNGSAWINDTDSNTGGGGGGSGSGGGVIIGYESVHNTNSVPLDADTWTDTGLSITYTPKSSSSKIVLTSYLNIRGKSPSDSAVTSRGDGYVRILEGNTLIGEQQYLNWGLAHSSTYQHYVTEKEWQFTQYTEYVNTNTNQKTFKVQLYEETGELTLNHSDGQSYFTVMEVDDNGTGGGVTINNNAAERVITGSATAGELNASDKLTLAGNGNMTLNGQLFVDKVNINDNIVQLNSGSEDLKIRGNGTGGSNHLTLDDDVTVVGVLTTTGGSGGTALHVKDGGDIRLENAGNTGHAAIFCDNGGQLKTNARVHDASGNLREIFNNVKTAAYTLSADDTGELINTNSNITVPSGVLVAGQAVTIFNNSNSDISIIRSGVTLWTAGTDSNTDKTLARKGICTIVCVSQNGFVISGAGLT